MRLSHLRPFSVSLSPTLSFYHVVIAPCSIDKQQPGMLLQTLGPNESSARSHTNTRTHQKTHSLDEQETGIVFFSSLFVLHALHENCLFASSAEGFSFGIEHNVLFSCPSLFLYRFSLSFCPFSPPPSLLFLRVLFVVVSIAMSFET